MEAQLLADYACVTGEEAHWHPEEQRLYWLDNETGRMFRYDPASGQHEQFYHGEIVGSFTFQEDGALLLFMARGAVKIWREGALRTVIDEIPEERDSRFNAAVADPMGRVFCGTMPSAAHPSRLYRLDPDRTITRVLEGITEANQMGFSPDLRRFYLTDTHQHQVYQFDYDLDNGAIRNQRSFVRIPEGEGIPDGLTVDAEGSIWSTLWGGGYIVRHLPDGREQGRYSLPVPKVSSMAFGGRDYEDAYVTTAGGNKKQENGAEAGALFLLRPGVRGRPEHRSRIRC
jgi:D-xylono/L-arabinono-1,4-lactonase